MCVGNNYQINYKLSHHLESLNVTTAVLTFIFYFSQITLIFPDSCVCQPEALEGV